MVSVLTAGTLTESTTGGFPGGLGETGEFVVLVQPIKYSVIAITVNRRGPI